MYIDRCEFPIQERIEVTTKNNWVYVFEGEGIVYFGKKYMDIFLDGAFVARFDTDVFASFEIDLPFDIG